MQDSKKTKPIIYAFIDGQNLKLGTGRDLFNKNGKCIYKGWELDFKKFYRYLLDKFRVKKALLFIGYIPTNISLYKLLESFGFELVFKPTVKDSFGKIKGNIDAELVLHSARIEYDNYDQAIIVSGDGDFLCLVEYLVTVGKLRKLILPNKKAASSFYNKYESYKLILDKDRIKLER